MAKFFESQETVTHLSQARVQWYGGILGGIREYREEKRLLKILNTPIYKGKSYYQITFHIISQTEKMVERQLQIQSLTTKDDVCYYGGAVEIFNAVVSLVKSWYDYAPDVANARMTIDDQKDVSLFPTVDEDTKDELRKLDLPEELAALLIDKKEGSSGCFGIILLFVICSSCLGALLSCSF